MSIWRLVLGQMLVGDLREMQLRKVRWQRRSACGVCGKR
jgi:hypothetical protein